MRHSNEVSSRQQLCTAIAASLLSLTIASAYAQRAAEPPQPGTSHSTASERALRERIEALEEELKEAKKRGVLSLPGGTAESSAAKQLSDRLAALEKAQRTTEARLNAMSRGTADDGSRPMSVRAPFIVLDDDGDEVFAVRVEKDNVLSLRLGSGNGGAVRALVNDKESWSGLSVIGSRVAPVAMMRSQGASAYVSVRAENETAYAAGLGISGGLPLLRLNNKAGMPVALLSVVPRESGEFVLADSDGTNMVEAGVSTKKVGLVRTGPRAAGAAAALGAIGAAASSIQGHR
jgi:hypothetical protein